MRERERRNVFGVVAAAALVLAMAASAHLAIVASAHAARPDSPGKVTARAAIVLDAKTGEILWAREPDRQLPPASTTKIMTTVLALESGRLERSLTVSPVAAAQAPSKLGLRPGQRVDLEDLTYALMLKSANDGAVVVAEGMAGSVSEFADLMNQRAREIGATRTQFRNPHGLPNSQHLSTVHDMALILRHALDVPGFREVAGTRAKVIQVEDSKVRPMSLQSKNRLLDGYFVPVLGKTGYTRAAGRCFAGAAELNGRRIITVVFGAPDMWGDTRRLMEFGFASFDDTAPAVQLALEQARKKPARQAVAKASKKKSSKRSTVAASKKAKSKGKAVARQATSTKSAKAAKSVKPTKSVKTAQASKATKSAQTAKSAQRAKATVKTAAKARAVQSSTSRTTTAAKGSKSSTADRHAKADSDGAPARR